MTATEETGPRTHDLEQAGHRLLDAFVAVCGAPDDAVVAAQANTALHDLEMLLR